MHWRCLSLDWQQDWRRRKLGGMRHSVDIKHCEAATDLLECAFETIWNPGRRHPLNRLEHGDDEYGSPRRRRPRRQGMYCETTVSYHLQRGKGLNSCRSAGPRLPIERCEAGERNLETGVRLVASGWWTRAAVVVEKAAVAVRRDRRKPERQIEPPVQKMKGSREEAAYANEEGRSLHLCPTCRPKALVPT